MLRSLLALAADVQHGLRKDRLYELAVGVSSISAQPWCPSTQRPLATSSTDAGVTASTSEPHVANTQRQGWKKKQKQRKSLRERLQRCESEEAAVQSDTRAVSGVAIIERYPIVFPPGDEWRKEFFEWQQNWNLWKYKTYPAKWLNCDKETDGESTGTTFQPEPIETEADRAGNIRSLRRLTPGFLYLVFKSPKDGPSAPWRFPSAAVSDSESLRGAVQRAVTQSVGESIETHIFGNAPIAHVDRAAAGAPEFCMMGIVLDGNVELVRGAPVRDYAWLTKREVVEAYAGDEAMLAVINAVLEE